MSIFKSYKPVEQEEEKNLSPEEKTKKEVLERLKSIDRSLNFFFWLTIIGLFVAFVRIVAVL